MMHKKALLEWYLEAGVDEAIDEMPTNWFALSKRVIPSEAEGSQKQDGDPSTRVPLAQDDRKSNILHHAPAAASNAARELADACTTLEELEQAVRAFDGCALKKMARQTVFADGNPKGDVLVIGEAPGLEEDKKGIPFCGPSGQLLDKVLASAGLSRQENVYISNTVYWRPPGNRQPSTEEAAICRPFVEKLVALMQPKLLVLCGGVAATSLMEKEQSISRLRGRLYDYSNVYLAGKTIPVAITYHPSYLLRQPAQKRLVWADMLMIQAFLNSKN